MLEFETYFGRQSRGQISDDFKRDLESLLKLSREARLGLVAASLKAFSAQTDREAKAIRDEIERRFGNEPVSLTAPLKILKFFAESFVADPEDDPIAKDDAEKIASDLAKMDNVLPKSPEDAEALLGETLKALKEGATRLKSAIRRMAYEQGILPNFKGVGTTVELRAVMTKKFEWGDDVDKYEPSLDGLVGVASIRIKLADSDPEHFSFQATEVELTNLISSLQAAQKQLRLLEQSIKVNATT